MLISIRSCQLLYYMSVHTVCAFVCVCVRVCVCVCVCVRVCVCVVLYVIQRLATIEMTL